MFSADTGCSKMIAPCQSTFWIQKAQKHIHQHHRHHRHPTEHGPTGVQPIGSASKLGLMGQFRAPWRNTSWAQPELLAGSSFNLYQPHLSVTQHLLLGQVSCFSSVSSFVWNTSLTHLTIHILAKFLSTISSVSKECAQPSGPARWFGARAARCRQSHWNDSHFHGEICVCRLRPRRELPDRFVDFETSGRSRSRWLGSRFEEALPRARSTARDDNDRILFEGFCWETRWIVNISWNHSTWQMGRWILLPGKATFWPQN